MVDSPSGPRVSLASRIFHSKKLGCLSAVLIPLIAFFCLVKFLNLRGNAAIEAMRQSLVDRGIPTGPNELEIAIVRVPREENGVRYLHAADALWRYPKLSVQLFDPPGIPEYGRPIDEDLLLEMRSALDINAEAISLFDRSRDYQTIQHYVNYNSPNLWYGEAIYVPGGVVLFSQLRCLDAQARRDLDEAVLCLLDLVRLSQSLDLSPCGETLRGMASFHTGYFRSLEDLLARESLDGDSLDRLDHAVSKRIQTIDVTRPISVELCQRFWRLDRERASQLRWLAREIESKHYIRREGPFPGVSTPSSDDSGLLYVAAYWNAICPGPDQLQKVRDLDEGVFLYDALPTVPLTDPAWLPMINEFTSFKYSVRGGAVGYALSLSDLHESTVRLQLSRVAIAFEKYRLSNGRWPDSIEFLEPGLRIDPCSGKPWRVKSNHFGVTVYSVGRFYDPVSDAADDDHISSGAIQFRLLDPEYRGRLPESAPAN